MQLFSDRERSSAALNNLFVVLLYYFIVVFVRLDCHGPGRLSVRPSVINMNITLLELSFDVLGMMYSGIEPPTLALRSAALPQCY